MKPNLNIRLAELMYGHGDKYMQSLSGIFEPDKFLDAPAIQIGELKCGCWVVADGNNRVGLILRKNADATLADIPRDLLAIYRYGDWDDDTMHWWNPEPKAFGEVMLARKRKSNTLDAKGKNVIHGMIERTARNQFNAAVLVGGKPYVASASKGEAAARLLEGRIKKAEHKKNIALMLQPLTPMESHRCR
ncbi:MAG: hypothetical protein AAB262_13700 [Elusimicrobiota bacterium]